MARTPLTRTPLTRAPLVRTLPHPPEPNQRQLRLAVLNTSAPAPGMNTAVRAAVRLGLKRTTLQSMLKRLGIEANDFRQED